MRSLVLTVQLFVGAFLGIEAQFVLAVGVIFYALPWTGLELLKTAPRRCRLLFADEGVGVVVGEVMLVGHTAGKSTAGRVAPHV